MNLSNVLDTWYIFETLWENYFLLVIVEMKLSTKGKSEYQFYWKILHCKTKKHEPLMRKKCIGKFVWTFYMLIKLICFMNNIEFMISLFRRCSTCTNSASVKTNSFFENSKTDLCTWVQVIDLWVKEKKVKVCSIYKTIISSISFGNLNIVQIIVRTVFFFNCEIIILQQAFCKP